MARPQKNNADYFSHDSSMRNDMKIKALRRKYGMDGYGLYCMMLELITGSDEFEFLIHQDNIVEWEILAGDFDIECDTLKEILGYTFTLGLFYYEGGKIYSEGLKKRLQQVTEKRSKMQSNAMKRWSKEGNNDAIASKSDAIASFPIAETIQSKVKETKEKEIKIKETTQVPVRVFSFLHDFFETYPKQKNQLEAENAFYALTDEEKSAMIAKLPQWISYWETIEIRFVPAPDKFLALKKWRDVVPAYTKKAPTPQRSLPTEILEVPHKKEDQAKIWQYFLSLDEEYRSRIEKNASDKFAHLPIRNTDVLVRNQIIVDIRSEYEKHQSQEANILLSQ